MPLLNGRFMAAEGSFTNNLTISAGSQRVVPLAMEWIEFELDLGEFGVAHDQHAPIHIDRGGPTPSGAGALRTPMVAPYPICLAP